MKKLLLATTLTSSIFAATTGTLNLQGEIAQILEITVNATTAASSIDLTTPQTDLKVADIVERSNDKDGYSVQITSANGGKLKNGTADQVTYTLKYGTSSVDLVNGSTFNSASSVGEFDKEVFLSHSNTRAQVDMAAGVYTDQVTFEISAN